MNEQILLTKMGFATHKAIANTIVMDSQGWERSATCLNCNQQISAIWLDDEDRLTGWSSWKSSNGSTCKKGE